MADLVYEEDKNLSGISAIIKNVRNMENTHKQLGLPMKREVLVLMALSWKNRGIR